MVVSQGRSKHLSTTSQPHSIYYQINTHLHLLTQVNILMQFGIQLLLPVPFSHYFAVTGLHFVYSLYEPRPRYIFQNKKNTSSNKHHSCLVVWRTGSISPSNISTKKPPKNRQTSAKIGKIEAAVLGA